MQEKLSGPPIPLLELFDLDMLINVLVREKCLRDFMKVHDELHKFDRVPGAGCLAENYGSAFLLSWALLKNVELHTRSGAR